MAVLNVGLFRMSLLDFDGQARQFSFESSVLTVGNIAAETITHDALIASIQAVTLGTIDFHEMVADRESIRPRVFASAAAAQVSIEWVVTYVDDVTTEVQNVRIPTADLTIDALLAAGSHLWDPTFATWVTFTTDFEAHVLSAAGNTVTLQQVAFLQ